MRKWQGKLNMNEKINIELCTLYNDNKRLVFAKSEEKLLNPIKFYLNHNHSWTRVLWSYIFELLKYCRTVQIWTLNNKKMQMEKSLRINNTSSMQKDLKTKNNTLMDNFLFQLSWMKQKRNWLEWKRGIIMFLIF